MQNLIFGPALFYDIPEYLSIVSAHSFWEVFSLGHFPIHPIFMAILWILIKLIPVNVVAMLFGTISVLFVYKISKVIFKSRSILPALVFSLFPGVWLINTNLMVESMTLTFFILSVYFLLLKKQLGFFLSLFLMIGTHLQSIFWIPAILVLPYIFEKEIKLSKAEAAKFIKTALISIVSSLGFYAFIYLISGREVAGSTEQISVYFSSGAFRMVRNIWLSFVRAFGSFTPLVFAFVILKYVKSKKTLIGWAGFFALVALIGANWQGDFMPRRLIFASVFLALGLYKIIRNKSVLLVLYLIPIVLANVILYSKGSPFPSVNLPENQVLIVTHYLKPFTGYKGTILWIGESDLTKIDEYLKTGKRVFLTKESITAPYMLLVGNNYHITSLGKARDSESRFLFKKYSMSLYGGFLELKLTDDKPASKEAGEPVIFYDPRFWGRLARRRIDYGDIGTWIWAIVTDHRDPQGWSYKDPSGTWVQF